MSVHNVKMSSMKHLAIHSQTSYRASLGRGKGEQKFVLNGPGHMTKMAAISIYGINLYKTSSPEPRVYDLKIGMQNWGKFYKSGINDDLWLTVTYFTAWS